MKKTLKVVMAVVIVFALCVSLAACAGKGSTKKAYKVINDGKYVLEGTVVMEGDKLVDCNIDEYYSPIMWGNLTENRISEGELFLLDESNIFTALYQGWEGVADTQYAKYIKIGDKIFTAGADANGYIIYSSDGIDDIIKYFNSSDANMAWYLKEMRAGNYWVMKKLVSGNYETFAISAFTHDYAGGIIAKGLSQSKRVSLFWEGWMPNIQKIEDFFINNGLIAGTIGVNADGVGTVADAVTGATITEFPEYAAILYEAAGK